MSAQEQQRRRERKARLDADPTLAPHGHLGTYTGWMCRCPECRQAFSDYSRERKRARKAAAQADPSVIPEHGINGYDNYGCRCRVCRAARRDYVRQWRGSFPRKEDDYR